MNTAIKRLLAHCLRSTESKSGVIQPSFTRSTTLHRKDVTSAWIAISSFLRADCGILYGPL